MNKITQDILSLTDQCVRCGLCMPHCPTNKLNNSEGYSPRGRIALWKNLAQDNLQLTPKTQDYLQSCLSCGTCDNNCPAGVKFSQLQNLGKSYLQQQSLKLGTSSTLNLCVIKIFSSRVLTKSLHYGLYAYQKLKLHNLVTHLLRISPRLSNKIDKLYGVLPTLSLPWKYGSFYKATINLQKSGGCDRPPPKKPLTAVAKSETLRLENKISDVIIFIGCVNNLVAQNKIKAAVKILTHLGINTHLSKKLHCCGALQKHNGFFETFSATQKNNSYAAEKIIKNNKKISHILTLDTGCHVSIVENFKDLATNGYPVSTSNFENFLYDLLLGNAKLLPIIKSLSNIPSTQSILHYTPCSQREQLKQPNITKNLLELILDKNQIIKISEGLGCCGAAGTYMFSQSKMAENLAIRIIADLPVSTIDTVNTSNSNLLMCTTNSGCALHLNTILRQKFNAAVTMTSSLELIAGIEKRA